MLHEEFDRIFEETVEKSRSVLASKSKEYSTEDKLHNFKVSAATRGVSNRDALAGMMVKHTTSIYDLLRAEECADLELWDEKIGDHINYLILLRAMVIEELGEVVFESVVDAFAEGISSQEDWAQALVSGNTNPTTKKFTIHGADDVPSMPFIPQELHTTYKCSFCAAQRVNTTQSGTLYDRIQCLECMQEGIVSFMRPIIENKRSGVDKMYTDPIKKAD